MKVKISKKELRECVESAVLRLVQEGKSVRKFKDDDVYGGKKTPKHGKLDKRGSRPEKGGNKGNHDWTQFRDDE